MHGPINIDNDMLPMRHMDVYEYRSNEAPSEGRTEKGGEGRKGPRRCGGTSGRRVAERMNVTQALNAE